MADSKKATDDKDNTPDAEAHEITDIIEHVDTTPDAEALGSAEDAEIIAAAEEAEGAEPVVEQAAPPSAAQAPRKSGGGFFATVLGGIVAAAIGFGMARYVLPEGWPFGGGGNDAELTAALTAQDAKLADISGSVDKLSATVSELDPGAELSAQIAAMQDALGGRIDTVSAEIGSVTAKITDIEQRLTDVEKRPISEGADVTGAVEAYQRELEAMRSELSEQRSRNEEMTASISSVAEDARAEIEAATDRAKAVETRAAMLRIQAALETGGGFATALGELGDVDVPAPLRDVATNGVVSLSDLQKTFPQAARDALAASISANAGEGTANRLGSFLRSQLGVRSLEPREGDDPDAILSRAEAATASGDLETALQEIGALPQPGQDALGDWAAGAKARLTAIAAAQSLAQTLNIN